MHQLLSALFAILLTFCHHNGASRSTEATVTYYGNRPTPMLSFPGREELAHGSQYGSYAGSECPSCRTMDVAYTAR